MLCGRAARSVSRLLMLLVGGDCVTGMRDGGLNSRSEGRLVIESVCDRLRFCLEGTCLADNLSFKSAVLSLFETFPFLSDAKYSSPCPKTI